MIPFAFALSLLTPLVEAFGNIFIGIFSALPPIIEAVAAGIVTVFGGIGDLITTVVGNLILLADPSIVMGLYTLAPALIAIGFSMIPLAYGLTAFALSAGLLSIITGGSPFDMFGQLAEYAPGIDLASKALSTLASSSSGLILIAPALAALGLAMTPLALGLGAFALAAGLLSIITGGGPFDMFKELSEYAPGIDLASNALSRMSIALGGLQTALAGIDTEKLSDVMNPGLGGVVLGLGTAAIQGVTDAVGSIAGAFGAGEGEDPNQAVVEELQQVKEILSQILGKEGSVKIDSTKAGTAFSMGTSRLQ